MNWDLTLLVTGMVVGAVFLTWLLSRVVRSIRGRTPAERAARNFAQDRRDKRDASKRESRRQLVRNFFRGCWRGFLGLLGLGRKAGGAATRAWLGPSLNPTRIRHKTPPSGRVSKISRRINRPI